MTHIDEKTLELYVLGSAQLAQEREEIERHLKECEGCTALHREIASYYNDVKAVRDEQARETSEALTVRSMLTRVPPRSYADPLNRMPMTLPARVVLFIIRHPYTTTTGVVGFFVAALFLSLQLLTVKDRNLSYARAKDEFLVAYNKEGQELWRKHMGIGYDLKNLRDRDLSLEPDEYLATIDSDNDGKSEVIATLGAIGTGQKNTIVSFRSDGSEIWRYEFHRNMIFGTEAYADKYSVQRMMVGDFDKDGKPEVIGVAAVDTYYPTAVFKLDAANGRLLGEYWNSSNIYFARHHDLDGDGIENLMFASANNGYDRAALIVIDPRAISGCSPAPPAYTPQHVPAGTAKYYILFPPTDLKAFVTEKRCESRSIVFQNDTTFHVTVSERTSTPTSMLFGVMYHFNRLMECMYVDPVNPFVVFHRRLETEGKIKRNLDPAYWEELRRGVQYWDGEKLVNTPTMNKKYVEAIGKVAKN